MTKTDYSNQVGLLNPERLGLPVHVIGAGGIGSSLIALLLKLGVPELHLWDADVVEPHNIHAQQLYRLADIGQYKVDAANAFAVWQEADTHVIVHHEFVTADTELEGIVFSGVDSMRSRLAIWEAVHVNRRFIPLYVDGRMGGEKLQLLTLNPSKDDEVERYKQWLFPDEDADDLPCASRSSHIPAVLAGLMVEQLTLYTRKEVIADNIMFNLQTMRFVAPSWKKE